MYKLAVLLTAKSTPGGCLGFSTLERSHRGTDDVDFLSHFWWGTCAEIPLLLFHFSVSLHPPSNGGVALILESIKTAPAENI